VACVKRCFVPSSAVNALCPLAWTYFGAAEDTETSEGFIGITRIRIERACRSPRPGFAGTAQDGAPALIQWKDHLACQAAGCPVSGARRGKVPSIAN
jgi:hypothetical protein